MRTRPKLSDNVNEFGFFEIRWSEMKNGRWRSKRRSTGKTKYEDAVAELSRFLTIREVNDDRNPATVSEVFDAYLKSYSRARGNETTDRYAMRAPLLAFGPEPAGTIRDSDVEAYARRRERGAYGARAVKSGTIRREIVCLQAVLNWGSQKQLIPGKPVFKFPKPSDGPPKDKWLTENQQAEIAEALKTQDAEVRFFVRAALTYGARAGAIMELTFGPQVDFLTGILDFYVPGARKTRKRRPVAPMTETIRRDLEELFALKGRGAKVCGTGTKRRVERFLTGLGYDWVTPHVFKHTAITQLLRAGVTELDVARFTATDLRTIHRVYRHHSVDELLDIAAKRGI